MKQLLAIALLMFSFSVSADTITLNVQGSLTDEQKQELALEAQKKITEGISASSNATPQKVREWAEIGTAIGTGLASSARELGMAVNDFSKTRVGLFAMALIAWHYLGEDLVGIVFGTLWLLATIPLWSFMYRRRMFTTAVSYFEKGEGPNGARKIVVKSVNKEFTEDGEVVVYWIALLFFIVVGLVAIFA